MSRSGDAQPLLALGATICAAQSSSAAPIGQPSCCAHSPVLQRVGRRLYIQPPDLFLDHLAGLDSQFCSDSIICMPVDVTSDLGKETGLAQDFPLWAGGPAKKFSPICGDPELPDLPLPKLR